MALILLISLTHSPVGGWLVDLGVELNLILALSITFCSLSLCIISLSYNFWLSLFLLVIQGITMGVLDSCGMTSFVCFQKKIFQ